MMIAALALVLSTGAVWAQTAPDAEASALYDAGTWDRAATAYEALVTRDPENATYRYRYGVSLQESGRYDRAVLALVRADAAGVPGIPPPFVKLRVARAYAKLGERDRAIEWLGRAIDAGFAQPQVLESHPDFASMRSDARFVDAVERAANKAYPCRTSEERKQFDFWIGEWDVYAGDRLAGTNRITRILEGCVIFEDYTGSGAYSGKSFNVYDPATKRWKQRWVDTSGLILELEGEFRDGAMRLEGETANADGSRVMHKLTFYPLPDGRVRQHWQQSRDGGATWVDAFDGLYVRKGEKP